MTTRLSLRVRKVMMGEQPRAGALADIVPIPPTSREMHRGVVVPVGSSGWAHVDVEPGPYLVRAYMPSGDLLSRRVTAFAGKDTEVVLDAGGTPHEWLGWQGLVKSAFPGERVASTLETRMPPDLFVFRWVPHEATWSDLAKALRTPGGPSRTDVEDALRHPPPLGATIRVDSDALRTSFQFTGPGRERTYALVDRGGTLELLALPMPWTIATDGSYAVVDVSVPHGREEGTRIIVQDPNIGALLGYVAGGRLPSAGAMFATGTPAHQEFLRVVEQKLINPYVAALGVHLLLSTDHSPSAEWHDWARNLSTWFDWLPDGAVLLGALHLRDAQNDADIAAARQAFEDAIRRGIPVFAPVLRRLVDGVTALVDDPDVDAGGLSKVLPHLRRVARATAADQVLTVLSFGGHA